MDGRIETVKVAVIGAGVSGLKAAQTLLHNKNSKLKPEDIIIVEAQDRIGGRIYTDKTSSKLGYSYDLGASWFHDSLSNKVLDELIEENNKNDFDLSKDGYFNDKEILFYDGPQKSPLDSNTLRLNKIGGEFEIYVQQYYFNNIGAKDMSLKDMFYKYIKERSQFLTKEQIKHVVGVVRVAELWLGVSWENISAKYSVLDHNGRDLFNKKGYQLVIDKLVDQIPRSRLVLNQPVSVITRNFKGEANKPILVESKNGLKVFCNYLIVTVPLSILLLDNSSEQSITWKPPLPSRIENGLKTIHFGSLGKVVFEFESTWWDMNEDRFVIFSSLFTDEDVSSPLKELPQPFTYPCYIVNVLAMHKDSGIKGGSLMILTQAPLTEYLESHKDQAWDYFKPMLADLLVPGKKFTDPIQTLVTLWTTNPYIRGAYGATYPHDEPMEFIALVAGDSPQLGFPMGEIRFAGEHTILEGAGCVHGAYESGEREALGVLEKLGFLRYEKL